MNLKSLLKFDGQKLEKLANQVSSVNLSMIPLPQKDLIFSKIIHQALIFHLTVLERKLAHLQSLPLEQFLIEFNTIMLDLFWKKRPLLKSLSQQVEQLPKTNDLIFKQNPFILRLEQEILSRSNPISREQLDQTKYLLIEELKVTIHLTDPDYHDCQKKLLGILKTGLLN